MYALGYFSTIGERCVITKVTVRPSFWIGYRRGGKLDKVEAMQKRDAYPRTVNENPLAVSIHNPLTMKQGRTLPMPLAKNLSC